MKHERERNGQFAANSNAVAGRNPVLELLESGRDIEKILVRKGDRTGSVNLIIAKAKERGIPIVDAENGKLDSLAGARPIRA